MKKKDFITTESVFFRFRGDKWSTYKYVPPKPGDDTGYIMHNGAYLCNTSVITITGIPFYISILKKHVKGVLKFSDIEPITEAEYKIHLY
jgi:hypothetical protein